MNVVEVQVQGGETKPITSQRWSGVGQVAWLSDGSGLVMLATDQGSGFPNKYGNSPIPAKSCEGLQTTSIATVASV